VRIDKRVVDVGHQATLCKKLEVEYNSLTFLSFCRIIRTYQNKVILDVIKWSSLMIQMVYLFLFVYCISHRFQGMDTL